MHVTFLLTLQWYKVYQVISEISLPIFEKMTIISLFLPLRFQIKAARAVASCCTIYQSGPPNPPKVKKLVVFETKKVTSWGILTRPDELTKNHEKK